MIPEDMVPHQAAPTGGAADGLPGIGLEGGPEAVPGLTPEEKALHEAREKARVALEDGEVDIAVTALEEVLEKDPDDLEVRLVLAKTLRMTGDDGAALRHLSKLTRMAPEQRGVHVLMGDLQMDLGRADQAQASYAAERALVGDEPEILQKLAEAAGETGDRTTLLETYEAWAAAAPRDPQPLVALGTAYAEEGDFARSEELFRRAAELDPHAADMLFFNVGASILNRRPVTAEGRKQAAAAFRQALELNPKHAMAHFRLALTLIGLGELGEAREHLQTYLELEPHGAEVQSARKLLESLN
jgi:Flp pilus assembly protein TadD